MIRFKFDQNRIKNEGFDIYEGQRVGGGGTEGDLHF